MGGEGGRQRKESGVQVACGWSPAAQVDRWDVTRFYAVLTMLSSPVPSIFRRGHGLVRTRKPLETRYALIANGIPLFPLFRFTISFIPFFPRFGSAARVDSMTIRCTCSNEYVTIYHGEIVAKFAQRREESRVNCGLITKRNEF